MSTSAWTDDTPSGYGEVAASPEAAAGPHKHDGVSRVARNVAALAGGQVVTWTMTLLWTLVVPRALGPAGLGVVVSALSVSGVLGIVLGLGTRNYLVREIVVDRGATRRLVGTAIALRLLVAPLFAIAVVLYARLAHYDHEAAIVLYLAATATVLTLLAEPIQAGFQAIERMQYLAYSDVLNKSSQGLLGIALVLLGFRAVGIMANAAFVAGVVILLNIVWSRRFFRIEMRTNARRLVDMTRQSLAYWAFGVFGMVYLWIDAIMLSLMTRSEVVGWYGAPTRLFQTMMFVPVLLSTAWLPRLVGAFERSPAHLHEAARKPLQIVLLLSAPIGAATAMLADPVIHVLYGSAFANAVPVLVVLGLCIPPMYLNIMLAQVLLAAKRQLWWTCVMAGAAVFNPLLNLALIPLTETRYANGAIGAAISLLVTELIMLVTGFVLVGTDVFDRPAVRRCLLAVGASGAMWGVAYGLRSFGTVPAAAAGILTFVVLAAAFRLVTADDLATIRAALRRSDRGIPAPVDA